jgi:hypothetical protein
MSDIDPTNITTTEAKTPGVYITEVNSDNSQSEIVADTGPTEEAADGPKIEDVTGASTDNEIDLDNLDEGFDSDTLISGLDTLLTSSNHDPIDSQYDRAEDFPGETVLITPIPATPVGQPQTQLDPSNQVNGTSNPPPQSNPNEIVVQDINNVDVTLIIDSDIVRNYISMPAPVFFFLIPMHALNGPNTNLKMPKFEDVVRFTATEQIDSSNPWEGGHYTLTHDGFEVVTTIDNNFLIKHTFEANGVTYTSCVKDTPSIESAFTHEYTDDNGNIYKILMFPGVVKVTENNSIIFSEIGMAADKIFVESVLEYVIGFKENIVTNSKFDFLSNTKEIVLSLTSATDPIHLTNTSGILKNLFNEDELNQPLSSLIRGMLNDTSIDERTGRPVKDGAREFFFIMEIMGMPIINSAIEFARGTSLSDAEIKEWYEWVGFDYVAMIAEQTAMIAERALEIYRFNGEALSEEILHPFYDAATGWYTINTQIGGMKTKLFYKFSDGPFTFTETIRFDNEKNTAEMLSNAHVEASDPSQTNRLACTKSVSDSNEWLIKTADPITINSTIVTYITSHDGDYKVAKLLVFNIAIKTFETQAASRVRMPTE